MNTDKHGLKRELRELMRISGAFLNSRQFAQFADKRRGSHGSPAFTLIELLAVIAMLALLIATILPMGASARVRSRVAGCLDNQRQLARGWHMYANDNNDIVPQMGDGTPGVSWRVRPQSNEVLGQSVTNVRQAAILFDERGYRNGALYHYVKDITVIHCPGDGGIRRIIPRYVTYSGFAMSGISNRTQILHPGERFLWIEEDDPRSTTVVAGPQQYTIGENLGSWALNANPAWWDTPALHHANSTTFSYVDGHAENHRWINGPTLALAAWVPPPFESKASYANQTSDFSSPGLLPGDDTFGSPDDLPFIRAGIASSGNP